MLTFVAVPFLFLAAQTAAPAPAQSAEAQAAREAERNRVVCRREHVMGSNRPQRTCLTVAQWEELRERSVRNREADGRSAEASGPSMS